MNNTSLIVMTSFVLVAIGALMAINFTPKASLEITSPGLPPLQPKGIAVVHKGIPFTLNFDQQKLANDAILKADLVKKSDYPETKDALNFDKIIIYRFNASNLEIFPVEYKNSNLVFSEPGLDKDLYYMELSGGALKEMINSSFDM